MPRLAPMALPYLVVKPLGMGHLRLILRFQGVGVQAAFHLPAWQTLAARLHGRDRQRPEGRAYEALEAGDAARWLQRRDPLP